MLEKIEKFVLRSNKIEDSLEKEYKKLNGIYFTNPYLTTYIIDDLFEHFSDIFKRNIFTKKFLEPCVGVGNFVFAYLEKVKTLNLTHEQYKELINNIYVCDIDKQLLEIYKKDLSNYVEENFNILLDKEYFKEHIGTGLIFDLINGSEYIPLGKIFPNVNKFDIIVTNPPYKNLKTERTHYNDEEKYLNDKNKYEEIKKTSKKIFPHSIEGTLNVYKLFVEEIIKNYTYFDSYVSLLIPSSILRDKNCQKLREFILKNTQLNSIITIEEKAEYIKANQALCNLSLKLGVKKEKDIKIVKNFSHKQNNVILYESLEKIILNENKEMILLDSKEEYDFLAKLETLKKVKDFKCIINSRGELDLTKYKSYITKEIDSYKLLRGKNIKEYFFEESDEYVKEEYIDITKKNKYIIKERIICQQIANMNKKKRVTFSYIPQNYILGNSCNFISVLENNYGIDLYYLLGLFNSKIINWYFKVISSNNHINNYEIDSFPIPLNIEYMKVISEKVKFYLETQKEDLIEEIENLVEEIFEIEMKKIYLKNEDKIICRLKKDLSNFISNITLEDCEKLLNKEIYIYEILKKYNLDLEKFKLDVCNGILEKYIKISTNKILNHTTFKLSDLDMEMIKSVPEGGNWQNIPLETKQKSKRLLKINETGGRTTLYGRLAMNKPSYTITTYFNRPGNGTYVHPKVDRVISVREASRIQSFNEDYYFVGNQSDILKQVGNAVPPLLAYQIAAKIKEKVECNSAIDLFCGAGGMSSGFKEAGIIAKLGVDFALKACMTYNINNPEVKIICGDITTEEVKEEIVKFAKENKIDVICGGPPCQGFSHAGKRFIDDPRNQLFKEYVEVVKKVLPKVVILENVEGMITFQKGEIYKEILSLFDEMGYCTKGEVLLVSEYGVPQKRKRVIIIGVRKELKINPNSLFPEKLTEKDSSQITIKETFEDILNLECGEGIIYNYKKEKNNYLKLLHREISFKEYVDKLKNNINKQLNFNF